MAVESADTRRPFGSHIGQVRETNEDAHVVAALGAADVVVHDGALDEVFDPHTKPVLIAVTVIVAVAESAA